MSTTTAPQQTTGPTPARVRPVPEIELIQVGGKLFAVERRKAGRIVKVTISALN